LIRDPDGNIWDTDLLREFWNEIQHDIQIKTSILEDITVLAVPPRYKASFMFDWERAHTEKGSFKCLYSQDGYFAYTYPDEVQEHFGISGDTTQGGSTGSHPFEAWHQDPGFLPKLPFPSNFHKAKGFYYDEEPIEYEDRQAIERRDPSWRKREGRVISYTRESAEDNQFILYPRPSSVTWDDVEGEGMVNSVSGDTTGSETGVITQRTTSVLSSDTGIATEVLESVDNVLLIFDVAPTEVTGFADELDFPDFLTKYVRYGVLARAFMANTDGYIPSLANYWNQRYQLGIRAVKKFRLSKTKARNRRLSTENLGARRTIRHPRLPDGYPAQ
jgi:hypothetical protein